MWLFLTFAFPLGIACGSSPVGLPDGDLDPADLNILFIGNSLTYTNDLPGMLKALLDSAAVGPALVASSAFPNVGLEEDIQYGCNAPTNIERFEV